MTTSPLDFYLVPIVPETVFTGRVTSAPADPYVELIYNTGVTGSFGAPLEGQTVWIGSTSGGRERGLARLRSYPGGASGTLTIGETDEVGPKIQANDYITIKSDFRAWPRYPRFVQSGGSVTTYEDYDTAFTDQTETWKPQANAGPPGFAFLEGGSATISFVGDQSYAVANGATITGYSWEARGSSEGTSSSQGTSASPVVFTWTSPGIYLVSLTVTDSNGKTDTNRTWAVIDNPDNPSYVFKDFDVVTDNFDFRQGGGNCAFTVEGDASVDNFPEGAMILHVARGTITTATASWPFRTNILFAGWIMEDTITQDPEEGDVSFQAETLDGVMRRIKMFPVSLTDSSAATKWTQAKNLTVDRFLSYIYHYRSTLSIMASIVPSNYSGKIRRQDTGPGNLYNEIQSNLMGSIIEGRLICSHQSVLYHVIDYNCQVASERTSVTTRKMLHKGVWVNNVTIDERSEYTKPISRVRASGVAYTGDLSEDLCPLFSEAPGDAPKPYGSEFNYDRLILISQADLNTRTGHAFARHNLAYPAYRMQFINDGSFGTAPQELFPSNIEAVDNDRSYSYSGNLIPRRINRFFNHEQGYFLTSVEFEPEFSGLPGITVEVDCTPPGQTTTTVPGPPNSPLTTNTALIGSTTGSSFYFQPGIATTWQRRVSGLQDDQLGFLDLIPDPWSGFKQGYSVEKTIVWGSGRGFLVRSTDTGDSWTDRTSYLGNPGWSGETGTVIANVDLMELQGDIFREARLFVLASWQYTGAYHSAVALTDDGFDYDWYNITGAGITRVLGFSLDQGNGTNLYITTWEDAPTGTMYFSRYDAITMTVQDKISLGIVASTDIDSQAYFAHPFNRLAQLNEVFAFGRMNEPQGFTGTPHVLKSTGQGATGTWSIIEDTWGTTICGAFGADEDGYYYAVRNG